MAGQKPVKVPADDCGVMSGGEVIFPHKGEYVELYQGMTVGEIHALENLRKLGVQLHALKGDPGAGAAALEAIDPQFDALCELLADRLTDWTLTDFKGRPLPKPDGTAEPLRKLRAEELLWLMAAVEGETPSQRKKGSRHSGITLSATTSPETT